MPKQLSNKHFLFLFLAILLILILVVFYFFNPNFSNLISGNWTSENGKCQKNSVENVKSKLEQNQVKMSEIKQKLGIKYPKFANIKNSNANKNENFQNLQKYEPNTLLEDQVFWSIDKSSKCSENNLIRFDVANNEQKEIIKSILGQNFEIQYEIWNR